MSYQGETELSTLLRTMQPVLHRDPYVFCSLPPDELQRLPFHPLCVFREREGITVVATHQQARDSGLAVDTLWACMTLTVHSSLTAVGFLAAVTGTLADAGISVNAVSAWYHDHLFVPWDARARAMEKLEELSRRE